MQFEMQQYNWYNLPNKQVLFRTSFLFLHGIDQKVMISSKIWKSSSLLHKQPITEGYQFTNTPNKLNIRLVEQIMSCTLLNQRWSLFLT